MNNRTCTYALKKAIALFTAVVMVILVFPAGIPVYAKETPVHDDFEVDYGGWTSDSDFAELTAHTGEGYGGSRGMKFSNRQDSSDSVYSQKGFYLWDGVNYNYSIYVRHEEPQAQVFAMTLRWLYCDDGIYESEVIAEKTVQPGKWTKISGKYATPKGTENHTVFLATDSAADFWFDEFTVTNRELKSPFESVSAAPANPGLKDIYASHFRVGNILNGTTVNNNPIKALILKEYNSITCENEMKPDATLTQNGSTNDDIKVSISRAAAIMKFCSDNKIPLRGHVLTWHGQTPDWFFIQNMQDANWRNYRNQPVSQVPWATPAVMNQRLESYIKNLFALIKTQYPTLNLYAYDVVNEAAGGDGGMRPPGFDFNGAGGIGDSNAGDSPWQAVYGTNNTSWITNAFTYARRYAPKHTKLFYNDFNEWHEPKRNYIINSILTPLKNAGVLDGMGMQSHVSANPNDGWSGWTRYRNAMDAYAAAGVEIHATELETHTNGGQYVSTQPERYKQIFEHAIAVNARGGGRVTAICIWTPNDANTWVGSQHTPALHDANNNPKPAYSSVVSVVPQAQWGDGNNPTFPGANGNSDGPDENFHIYLCFGQSNMEGQNWNGNTVAYYDTLPNQYKTGVDPRFRVMEAVGGSYKLSNGNQTRVKGEWYTAVPPLARSSLGLSPADYFGRTLVSEISDPNVKIGVIVVAVGGAAIEGFEKGSGANAYFASQPDWMQSTAAIYGNNPYNHLITLAKQAQNDGVIKGILMHQGESGATGGNNVWGQKVKGIYDNMLTDLNLAPNSIPFLAGQTLGANNNLINALPTVMPGVAHVISSSGLVHGGDNIHFNYESYKTLGERYGAKMLELNYSNSDKPIEPDPNGYYFRDTFEGSSSSDTYEWEPRGGDTNVNSTASQPLLGLRSLSVRGRSATWHGAIKPLNSKAFKAGTAYSFSVCAYYPSTSSSAPAADNFALTLEYTNSAGTTAWANIATATAAKGNWVQLANRNFTIPVGASNLKLIVEMPNSETMNFYIDEAIGAVAGTVITVDIPEPEPIGMEELFAGITPTASLKAAGNNNPLMTQRFSADPGAMVYKDRMYVYTTNDVIEYDSSGKVIENTYSKVDKINCISSADLVNWTDHGAIPAAGASGAAKHASQSWAPCATWKTIDGKDKFFLYFCNNASGIAVLTADSPTGPWTDPIGKSLVNRNTPGCANVVWCFDPAVFIDDDGTGYLYLGGGIPEGQAANPKTARVVKLNPDMTSVSGSAVEIDAPYLFEDSGINKIGNTYYYSYCSNFNTGNFSQTGFRGGVIQYMTSNSPMGPFTYKGEVFRNPNEFFPQDGGNNHHAMIEFKGQYYMLYHARQMQNAMGITGNYRSAHIDNLTVNADGTLKLVTGTMTGVPQVGTLNPYNTVRASTIWRQAGINVRGVGDTIVTDIQKGDWIGVKGASFADGAESVKVRVSAQSAGAIKVCTGSPTGTAAGYIEVPATNGNFMDITASVSGLSGTQNVYFVFSNAMEFESWSFTPSGGNPLPTGPRYPIVECRPDFEGTAKVAWDDVIGYLDAGNPPGAVAFTINVAEAGKYKINVNHVTAYGAASHSYQFNSGAPIIFNYPQSGDWLISPFSREINLNEGNNTVRIAYNSGITEVRWIEIEKVNDVSTTTTPNPTTTAPNTATTPTVTTTAPNTTTAPTAATSVPNTTTPISTTTNSDTTTTSKSTTTDSDTTTTPKSTTTDSDTATTPKSATTDSDTATTPKSATTDSDKATTPKSTTTNSDTATTPKSTTTSSDTATTPKSTTTVPNTTTTPKSTTTVPNTTTTPKSTTTVPNTTTTPNSTTTVPNTATTPKSATTDSDTATTPKTTTTAFQEQSTSPETTTEPPVSDCDCDRADCNYCNENGKWRALGDVDGKDGVTIFDALEILKHLVGMDCVIIDSEGARYAAFIANNSVNSGDGEPSIFDALEILKSLVNMECRIDGVHINGVPRR